VGLGRSPKRLMPLCLRSPPVKLLMAIGTSCTDSLCLGAVTKTSSSAAECAGTVMNVPITPTDTTGAAANTALNFETEEMTGQSSSIVLWLLFFTCKPSLLFLRRKMFLCHQISTYAHEDDRGANN